MVLNTRGLMLSLCLGLLCGCPDDGGEDESQPWTQPTTPPEATAPAVTDALDGTPKPTARPENTEQPESSDAPDDTPDLGETDPPEQTDEPDETRADRTPRPTPTPRDHTPPPDDTSDATVANTTPRPGDGDGDGFTPAEGDCDDTNAGVHPGAVDVCSDTVDQDCDGIVDNPKIWYSDTDGDGWGGAVVPRGSCTTQGVTAQPGDCNDRNPAIHPGASESCDGVDNDCSAATTEVCTTPTDPDVDQDGVSVGEGDCNDNNAAMYPGATEVCDGVDNDCNPRTKEQCGPGDADVDGDGITIDEGDCDDENSSIKPGEVERCNGLDDDCDGIVDEDVPGGCEIVTGPDLDGDGYTTTSGDCNDVDVAIHPGAEEICDGHDNNCNGEADEEAQIPPCDTSLDGDGDGITIGEGDCDDHNPSSGPGEPEICDGQDNDCDGIADENLYDCTVDDTFHPDRDSDGYSLEEGDCDDRDSTVNPGAIELCDLQDNDCDGSVDEQLGNGCDTDENVDSDGDGYTPAEGDCDDADDDTNPDHVEVCDLSDNNCDGEVDEDMGGQCPYDDGVEADHDGDGVTVSEGDCHDYDGSAYPGADETCDGHDDNCDGHADEGIPGCETQVDGDGDGVTVAEGDCNDADPDVNPQAEEVCNLWDDNCNGIAEEGLGECNYAPSQTVDHDGDGFTLAEGDCQDNDAGTFPGAVEGCDGVDNNCNGVADEGLASCPSGSDADGDGITVEEGDCDDHDPDSYPGADEVCDLVDNNCNGIAEEGGSDSCGWPADHDYDGDGVTSGEGDCDDTDSSVTLSDTPCDDAGGGSGVDLDGDGVTLDEGDCDDLDSASIPGGVEICDGRDNDCDGIADEDLDGCDGTTDLDGDGITVAEGDCDDHNASTGPGSTEVCDSQDNDCDGSADDGLTYCGHPADHDYDGDGTTILEGDCDDFDSGTSPGSAETCNGQDDNCNGTADEAITCDLDPDVDHDGDGVTISDGDCDDTDADSYPDAGEICDGQDNNCDGWADENLDLSCLDPGHGVDVDGDGTTLAEGDCDDLDAQSTPGGIEVCDGRDNNCNGTADEDLDGCPSNVDADDDGITVGEGDCDDSSADANPGALEQCNGADDNCNGVADEGMSCGYPFDQDQDGDGTTILEGDCDDLDSGVAPGIVESCDGQDNNCNGVADENLDGCPVDSDDDGDGVSVGEGDCDDTNPGNGPAFTEYCDGQDNNCDGIADEGFELPCEDASHSDLDGDGFTVGEGDCDDHDASQSPAEVEICDGRDNNCDGQADEDLVGCDTIDLDEDGDGVTIGDGDCDDGNVNSYPGADELCDGSDNNCDGLSDEGLSDCVPTDDNDVDGDGYTSSEGDCNDVDPTVYPDAPELCDRKDNDCDQIADEGAGDECSETKSDDEDGDGYSIYQADCDDTDSQVYPGAPELCDLKDNDCDGSSDEGIGSCDLDVDGDADGTSVNQGDCDDADAAVEPGAIEVCDHKDNNCNGQVDDGITAGCDLDGDGYTTTTDCDDSDADVHPGATELCDLQDNDCDGQIDEGTNSATCDIDGDGYSLNQGDCNPNDPAIHPGASEVCDQKDNDCNAEIDDGLEDVCDFDGDGFTLDDGDCNDGDPTVNPGATEICDVKDNDCEGGIDEDLVGCDYDQDYDHDGWTLMEGDCNDQDADTYPGAEEVCDLRDNDCNGITDDDLPPACILSEDLDDDGFTITERDCNDLDPAVYPGAPELCDEKDNDCDRTVDDVPGGCTYDDDLDDDGWSLDEGDCNDGDATVYPGAPEICDRQNNDCALQCDMNDPACVLVERTDDDGDGFIECTGDCDDADPGQSPTADEVWYDGIDSDCDGEENPDACSEPPPAYVVPVVQGCKYDLEMVVLTLCPETETSCALNYVVPAVFEVRNHGTTASPAGIKLAVYGVTAAGRYFLIQTDDIPAIPAGTSSGGFRVNVQPYSDVYRFTSLVLSVDDDGTGRGEIRECDESNNRGTAYVAELECPTPDACTLPPPGHPVDSDLNCQFVPPRGQFSPVVEWQRQSFALYPSYNQVMAQPVVGNLTDDNFDGRVDENDVPDVVFTTYTGSAYSGYGVIRALSGDDGRELWAAEGSKGAGGVSLADADADGSPEVYTMDSNGDLMAITNKGQILWHCDVRYMSAYSNPSVADTDGDGDAEILLGDTLCSHTGQRLAVMAMTPDLIAPFLLDMDQNGIMEIVSGAGVSNLDGTTRWVASGGQGAVANFDGDVMPELVTVNRGTSTLYLHDHDGRLIWASAIPGGRGGPPTIADFDGDGQPEIGVAAFDYYAVFETNGSLRWAQPIHDHSSSVTGSSVYDFDGDGRAEVVQADEYTLWVWDGATGQVLVQIDGHASGTLYEYPVIADVDRDGHVEIVLASNNYAFSGWTGITVFGDVNNNWVTGRPVWNQHAYHITNINDDLSVPRRQSPNWIEGNNTFRQGGFGSGGALAAPDLVPYLVDTCTDTCASGAWRVLFQVENFGANTVESGLPWVIYGVSSSGSRVALVSGSVPEDIPPGLSSGTVSASVSVSVATPYPQILLSIDDDGTTGGTQNECVENNNTLLLPPLCQ